MSPCESAVVRKRSEPRIKRSSCCAGLITVETVHKTSSTNTDDIVPAGRDHSIGKRIDPDPAT